MSQKGVERARGFEPPTFSLGSWHSTTESRPLRRGQLLRDQLDEVRAHNADGAGHVRWIGHFGCLREFSGSSGRARSATILMPSPVTRASAFGTHCPGRCLGRRPALRRPRATRPGNHRRSSPRGAAKMRRPRSVPPLTGRDTGSFSPSCTGRSGPTGVRLSGHRLAGDPCGCRRRTRRSRRRIRRAEMPPLSR